MVSDAPVLAATPIRKRPGYDVSATGFIYMCIMLFMCAAAMTTQVSLLFGVFGLMVGILLVSFVITRFLVLVGLSITRGMPDHGVVGRPVTLTYRFTNSKKFWPSLSVTLGELDGVEGFIRQPQSYLLHAAAGATAIVPVEVVPKRRGLHTLGAYQIGTSFPFGFIKRATIRSRHDTMLVYPPIAAVDPKLLTLCQPAEKTGPTIRPRRGGADEFYGLKEHRRGENPRWIYWRRSARTGVLVAKEMTQVAPPRLLLLVDTYVARRTRSEHAMVEKAIAMAASLTSTALEQGLSVGVHAWAGGWNGLLPAQGKRQRRDLMSMLARLPLNLEHDAQALITSSQNLQEPGTTLVLMTGREVELGWSDKLRSGIVVVSADSAASRSWFKFDPRVDFNLVMPPEQENGMTEN